MGDALKLKTDRTLLDAIERAKSQKMTAAEALEQRVSFIFSSMDDKSAVTREHIRAVLEERERG